MASSKRPSKASPAPTPPEVDSPPAAPAAEPAAAPAASEDQPKGKKKKKKPHRPPQGPPIYLPRDADELIALDRPALDRLTWETSIRLGKARRRRAELLSAMPLDEAALSLKAGEIAELGALMHCLTSRRGQLRREARQANGQVQERAEAIAAAVDLLVSGGMWRKIQDHADRILATAEKDLAAGRE